MKKGIDVSVHQGVIDWSKVRGLVDFAIIRAGMGNTAKQRDEQFLNNINGCIKYGIPYGFYWFSYAHTEAEAIKEAKAFLEVIKPYKPEYPVAFDFEYEGYDYVKRVHNITLSKEQLTKNAKAFLKTLEQAGYYTINYSNLDYLNNRFTPEITSRFDLWYARPNISQPDKKCGIWQYSWAGKVAGISTDVDMNYAYKDYPAIIKSAGLNGFAKTTTPKPETKKTATVTVTVEGKTYKGNISEI